MVPDAKRSTGPSVDVAAPADPTSVTERIRAALTDEFFDTLYASGTAAYIAKRRELTSPYSTEDFAAMNAAESEVWREGILTAIMNTKGAE